MLARHFWLMGCWILFGGLHSVMASLWFKAWVKDHFSSWFRFYRPFYSAFSFFTLALILWFHFSIRSIQLWEAPTWAKLLAGLMLIAGILLMILCDLKYFKQVSGIRVLAKKEETHILEQHGLHAWVRHPLYLGTLIFVWSLFIFYPWLNGLVTCFMISAYTLIGIRWEEKKLVLEFGSAYEKYQQEVPMILPFFRRRKSQDSFKRSPHFSAGPPGKP
jgi:protein-S-isoprenylcysteine O-methyltransferase Ste14